MKIKIIWVLVFFLTHSKIACADISDSGNGVVGGTFTVTGNAFSVGGSSLTVKNGNVGIGTTNPGAPLSVKDTNAPAAGTYIQTAVGSYIGWDYLSGTSASKRWGIRNDGATYGDFQIVTESGNQGTGLNATRLYINGSGNVGIGTTNPGNPLVVNPGNSPSVFNGITVTSGTTNAMGAQVLVDGNDAATFNGASVGFTSNLPGALWIGPNQNARITVLNSGNVGLGTTSPNDALEVNGQIRLSGGGSGVGRVIRVTDTNGGTVLGALSIGASYDAASNGDVGLFLDNTASKRIYVQDRSGGVYLTDGATSWTSNSDRRLKRDIADMGAALPSILALQPKKFHWRHMEQDKQRGEEVGFIAQDVQSMLPHLVHIGGDTIVKLPGGSTDTVRNTLGLNTTDLIPYLVKAIQEQQKQIDESKIREIEMQKKIDALSQRIK